jgi:hypothetical protein
MNALQPQDPIVRLEQLRQQIEAAHNRASGKAEFLELATEVDRSQRTQASYSIMMDRAREGDLLAELCAMLQELRMDSPDVVQAWVDMHRLICQRIANDPAGDGIEEREFARRRDVAQRTQSQWESVASGKQDCVRINEHLLGDYRREMEAWLARALGKKK